MRCGGGRVARFMAHTHILERVCRRIAPDEWADAAVMPVTLLLRPLPIGSLMVLLLNDHLWKGSRTLPSPLTGKVSDVAGLFFFPLLLVTLWNLLGVLCSRIARKPLRMSSPSLRQVIFAIVLTGGCFAAIQLHPWAAHVYISGVRLLATRLLSVPVSVVSDPTDLIALIALWGTIWHARQELRRVPPGRLALARWQLNQTELGRNEEMARLEAFIDLKAVMSPRQARGLECLCRHLATGAPPRDVNRCLEEIRNRS
jgi:hypothetical protein